MSVTPEFVRLTPAEQVYSKKQFLYSEMGILTLMQRYAEFEALRKQELALKINLKISIMDAIKSIELLDSVLPKITTQQQKPPREEVKVIKAEERELEKQIEDIKRRLARLGGGY